MRPLRRTLVRLEYIAAPNTAHNINNGYACRKFNRKK